MIEYYKKENGENVKKTEHYSEGCWVNITNPNPEEIDFICKKLKLKKESVVDGLDIHESPRFEIIDKKVYIYLTAPTEKISNEYDSSFLVIYSKNQFITISKNPLEIFERILGSKFVNFSELRNLVRILFILSRMFEESIKKIRKEIKNNKAELKNLSNRDVEKLIEYEDKLNEYISSFGATIGTYSRILREKSLRFLKKDEEIIKDLIVDLNETFNLCKQTLLMLSNMRNYYSTKISHDLNKTVTILTIATIFLSVPTLIAAIYGMNIKLPFQNNPYIFVSLMVLIFLILGSFLILLRKTKVIK